MASNEGPETITLEGGGRYEPQPDDPVRCEDHDVTVKWGDLDAIQRLAVAEGLDVDGRCILLPDAPDA